MRWFHLMPLAFLASGVFSSNKSESWESISAPEETLRKLLYLPYENTVTLSRHVSLDMSAVVVDTASGMYTTRISAEEKESLRTTSSVPRGVPFSFYSKHHAQAAKDLIKVFLDAKDLDELRRIAVVVRDHVNEVMFLFALSHAFYERKDLNPAALPPLETVLPDRFVPTVVLNKAKQLAKDAMIGKDKDEAHVYWPTNDASVYPRSPEHRVAYWREDIDLGRFYWHWHLLNPRNIEPGKRDRRGELFYYMNHNLVARYNMERLSVNLEPVEAFKDWKNPIKNGYFPPIACDNGYDWASRQDHTLFKDVNAIPLSESTFVSKLDTWRTNLLHAFGVGYLIRENGPHVRLTDNPRVGEDYGIDLVGEAVEAGASVNPGLYGDLNTLGHDLLSQCHDPVRSHKSNVGVLAATETAIRDPVFFRWHKFIDDVFLKYKMTQPPYTPKQLHMNVEVMSVTVTDKSTARAYYTPRRGDQLHTYFRVKSFEATNGIDFKLNPEDHFKVHFQSDYLQHTHFYYTIKVFNRNSEVIRPKVRIFLAPKFDNVGQRMNYSALLHYWTEMDVFEADPILPGSSSYITRDSSESSIFGFDSEAAYGRTSGCGWPKNLQLPRGKPDGMNFLLFVMVTDSSWDTPLSQTYSCTDLTNDYLSIGLCSPPLFSRTSPSSFCGLPSAKYPDRWPMGYPLDRKSPHETIEAFVNEYPNMRLHDFVIKHLEAANLKTEDDTVECLRFRC
uniref:Prophenoloxidase beta n=1 Tax=Penaeus monodon TaxID=6687 RepID=A0A060PQG9_PENMO|nr:prophenoloxidase beta [Penaeus monodon]